MIAMANAIDKTNQTYQGKSSLLELLWPYNVYMLIILVNIAFEGANLGSNITRLQIILSHTLVYLQSKLGRGNNT